MVHIREYPEFDELHNYLVNLWEEAVDDFLGDELEELDPPHELDEIITPFPWGTGDASLGDGMRIAYVFTEIPTDESQVVLEDILDTMELHIRGEVPQFQDVPTVLPGPSEEWFGEIEIARPVYTERIDTFLDFEFTQQPGQDVVYSITEEEELFFAEIEDVDIERQFPQADIPYESLVELAELKEEEIPPPGEITPDDVSDILQGPWPDEAPDELSGLMDLPAGEIVIDVESEVVIEREPLEADPEEIEEEPEPEPEPEDVIEDEEEIGVEDIRIEDQIDRDRGIVEVPTGKKQSTRVDYRELYDFEKEMLAMGDGPTDLQINEGIGQHMAMGTFGMSAPPITFPRTGIYIKNRLLHEGPAYVRELHKDLCRYAWAIVEEYRVMVRPGQYEYFRGMVNNLKEAGLIEQLSANEAQELGFSVFPETPDGRTAFFLEQRQYYDIRDGEEDSNAWENVTEHLYG